MPEPTPSDGEDYVKTLDTRGLRCPLPVIKTEALLRKVPAGAKIKVLADDPLAQVDIPHFCREAGHHVEIDEDGDDFCVFLVTAAEKTKETV